MDNSNAIQSKTARDMQIKGSRMTNYERILAQERPSGEPNPASLNSEEDLNLIMSESTPTHIPHFLRIIFQWDSAYKKLDAQTIIIWQRSRSHPQKPKLGKSHIVEVS